LRFLLATYGSCGDVHPMLALARALARRGHQVVLAGPPDYAADAVEQSVAYRPMGGSMGAFLDQNSAAVLGHRLRLVRAVKRDTAAQVAAQFELLSALVEDADYVVAASLVFAARSCAERAGKPYRFIAFAPETFPSRFHPALGEPRQNLPTWCNRVSWWWGRRIDNYLLRAAINDGQRKLGLPPVRDVLSHFADASLAVLAADAELAPAPPDVPVPDPPTGAMILDDERPLPEEVEAFLLAGRPPVYIGFGSMPDAHPERTHGLLIEAIQRAGCRGIIQAGTSDARRGGADLLIVGAVPHARLLPRMAAVVHHGGAGTCARAARAGIPQVVVPHLLDQFPWAARLQRRGLAPAPLFRKKLTSRALAERLRQAVEDQAMRANAAAMGRTLARRDGAERAAEILSRA
jgi:vancomycin aglycone glucosyltransferase